MAHAGSVSLIGRPNAGKSTLLNRMVGAKVAIVSDKPQTTRTRILAVKHRDEGQIVFVRPRSTRVFAPDGRGSSVTSQPEVAS